MLFLIAGIFLGATLNPLISKAYGDERNVQFSNFSLVLCGLAIGETWDKAKENFASETRALNEADQAAFFYRKAWEKFRENPAVILTRLRDGGAYFLSHLPLFLATSVIWNSASIPRSLVECHMFSQFLIVLFLLLLLNLWRQRLSMFPFMINWQHAPIILESEKRREGYAFS